MSVAMWNWHSWPLDSVAMWNCQSRELNVRTGGVYLKAMLGTSSHIWSWSLHLTSWRGIPDCLSGVLHLTSHLVLFFWHIWVGVYLIEVNTASANLTCQNVLEQQYCILHLANMRPHDEISVAMSVAMWNCQSWPLDDSSNVKLAFLTTRCQ